MIKNGAPHPILSKIRMMDKFPGVFFLLGTLVRIEIATVNLLNAYCSKIPFISHIFPLLVLSIRWTKHFRNCLPSKTRNCFDKSFVE